MGLEMQTGVPFNEGNIAQLRELIPRVTKEVTSFALTYTNRKGQSAWEDFSSLVKC